MFELINLIASAFYSENENKIELFSIIQKNFVFFYIYKKKKN